MQSFSHAETILRARYYRKDPITREPLETADDLFWRVANGVAAAEQEDRRAYYAQLFHDAMVDRRWLPNSPTLMNAGMEHGDMCACVVLPIHDSMESIYGTLYNQAMLHRFGVGTGFDFSELREKHAFVYKTMGEASGPVSFLKVYDASTNEIKQGGRRRGANMATLRFDHPDVEEFINCKDSGNQKITNFNISLTLEDEHMIAVEQDLEIDLISPAGKKAVSKVKARDLLMLAAQKAWETGDPGVMFLSAMNAGNPTPGLGRLVTSNPCSESQLLPNEECTLGSLNLDMYVNNNFATLGFDWDSLGKDVRLLTRFLDDVVEQNYYVNDDLKKMHKEGNRKIGVGVMGWADALIRLHIPYESERAYSLGEQIMQYINIAAHDEDRVLAEERGAFPNYTHYAFGDKWGKQRNAHVTVIAPTGTIAILADCSSGVEPLFAITLQRTGLDGHVFTMVHPYFAEYATKHGWSQEVTDYVMRTGRLSGYSGKDNVTMADKQIWATAHDVTWQGHLNMLQAFQRHVDNGVSKTINLPHDATPETIYEIYIKAWKMGLKTVSVYRDGSKSVQVLNAGVEAKEPVVAKKANRPEILEGKTHKMRTDLGPAYITVNSFDDKPAEVFANVGRNGSAVQTMAEALGRVVSVALQNGVDPEALSRTLYGVGGNGKMVTTLPSAIAKVLGNGHFSDIVAEKAPVLAGHIQGDICPECHMPSLIPTGDCAYCSNCGFSKC